MYSLSFMTADPMTRCERTQCRRRQWAVQEQIRDLNGD